MRTPPIACSLTATGREQRAALVAALAADALLDRERTGATLVLRFRGAPGVEERVRRWAALEAECCPFLTMIVDAAGSVVTLRIDGPAEASGIIDDLLPVSVERQPPVD
jgi:hypothetical protein